MKIQEIRKKVGMTQKEFSKHFHISVRTLQRWELGTTETPEHIMYMIKKILVLEKKLPYQSLNCGRKKVKK